LFGGRRRVDRWAVRDEATICTLVERCSAAAGMIGSAEYVAVAMIVVGLAKMIIVINAL
jgi:hypothetical protein